MRTAVRTFAVADGHDPPEVGRNLNAPPVVRASAGLPPGSTRQVSHFSLQLLGELLKVERGFHRLERRATGMAEGFDVVGHLLRAVYFLDRVVGLDVDDARLVTREVEDVDHGMHASRRPI